MEKINSYKSTNGLGIRTELKMQCPMLAASKSKVFLASILFCLSLGTIFFTNHARAEEGMATSTPLEGGVPEIMVGEDSFSFTNPTITNLAITGTTVAQGRLASIGRKLARTADGLLHAVYIRSDGTHDQVYYSYSSNDGQSWVEEQITTASRNHDYPVIATDANNSIHLAWVHCQEPAGFGKTCIVQYRLKTSAGWQPVEDVLTGYLHAPAMAIDSQNNVHLVVRGYSPGAYNCDYLKYTKRTASINPKPRFPKLSFILLISPRISILYPSGKSFLNISSLLSISFATEPMSLSSTLANTSVTADGME